MSDQPNRACRAGIRRRMAASPTAPSSGISSVMQASSSARPPRAKSTASLAMTRYVVSLPPPITVRPGMGLATVCSRLTFAELVPSLVPGCSSGRSPAYHPMTSSRVRSVVRTSLACSRT